MSPPKRPTKRRGARAPDDLPRRVLAEVRARRLWEPGTPVLVGVSGGVDSAALLWALWETRAAHAARLGVASVDHGLRPEAAAEVERVGTWAAQFGLPFFPLRLDLQPGPDLGRRAREARRDALIAASLEFAAGSEGPSLALAHHADDQAETVLLHLLRGAGSAGLGGMAQRIPGPVTVVRPLLGETRRSVHAYAESRVIDWVEDPSNPHSLRGRLRTLWPSLSTLHGNPTPPLCRAATILTREDDLLTQLTDAAWARVHQAGGLDRHTFCAEHPAIQARLLLRLGAEHGTLLPPTTLDHVLHHAATHTLHNSTTFPLGAGRNLRVEAGCILLTDPPTELAGPPTIG